jgi:hypothetical protein
MESNFFIYYLMPSSIFFFTYWILRAKAIENPFKKKYTFFQIGLTVDVFSQGSIARKTVQ